MFGRKKNQPSTPSSPLVDPNATLIGVPQGGAPVGYDPNATLIGVPQGGAPAGYDPNATLIGVPQGGAPAGYDPNATLIGVPQGGAPAGYDPNATLIGMPQQGGYDPNATLIGQGPGDPNATLVTQGAGGGIQLVNASARIAQQAAAVPQIIPHICMIPSNNYYNVVDVDVLRTIKFGRGEGPSEDPDFISFNSKVVSRRHAEIWVVNGEFYIRDTRSQSGTFLNAMRLSMPGEESKPFKLKNGDVIQFGVDRRGATEENMKCVCMTIEISFRKVGGTPPAPYQQHQQPYAPHQPQQHYGAPMPAGGAPMLADLTLVIDQGKRQ